MPDMWLPAFRAQKRPPPEDRTLPPPAKRRRQTSAALRDSVEPRGMERLPDELLQEIARYLGPTDQLSLGTSRLRHRAVMGFGPLRDLMRRQGYRLAAPPEKDSERAVMWKMLRGALEGEHRIDSRILELWPRDGSTVREIDGSALSTASRTHICGQLLLTRQLMPSPSLRPRPYLWSYLNLAEDAPSWHELPIAGELVRDWFVGKGGSRLATLTDGAFGQTVRFIELQPDVPAKVVGSFSGLSLQRLAKIGPDDTLMGLPSFQHTNVLHFRWPSKESPSAQIAGSYAIPAAAFATQHVVSRDGRFVAFRMHDEPHVHLHDLQTQTSFVHDQPRRLRDASALCFSKNGRHLLEYNAEGIAYVLTRPHQSMNNWRCHAFRVRPLIHKALPRVLDVSGDQVLYVVRHIGAAIFGLSKFDGRNIGSFCIMTHRFARHHTLRLGLNKMVSVRSNRHEDESEQVFGYIDFSRPSPVLCWPVGPDHPARQWDMLLRDGHGRPRHVVHRELSASDQWRSQLYPVAASRSLIMPPESFGLPPGLCRHRLTIGADEERFLVEIGQLPWDKPPLMQEENQHTKAFMVTPDKSSAD